MAQPKKAGSKQPQGKKDNVVKIARTAANKARKVARHLRHHPKDTTKHGQVIEFPVKHKHKDTTKPTMMADKPGFWNPLTNKVEVPPVMYVVYGVAVMVEYTHLLSQAEEAYKELKCRAYMYRIDSDDKYTLLASKKAVPILSKESRAVLAFGVKKPNK